LSHAESTEFTARPRPQPKIRLYLTPVRKRDVLTRVRRGHREEPAESVFRALM
jgi:hypothetical protein